MFDKLKNKIEERQENRENRESLKKKMIDLMANYKALITQKVDELKKINKAIADQQEELPYPEEINDEASANDMVKILDGIIEKCAAAISEINTTEAVEHIGTPEQPATTPAATTETTTPTEKPAPTDPRVLQVANFERGIKKLEDLLNSLKTWVAHFNKATKEIKSVLTTHTADAKKAFQDVKSLQNELKGQQKDIQNLLDQENNPVVIPKDNKETVVPKDDKNTKPKDDKGKTDGTKDTNDDGTYDKGDVLETTTDTTTGTTGTVPSATTAIKIIYGSVGAGGKNNKNDVKTVQELLNKKGFNITADGACGPKTVDAIKKFQKTIPGSSGDGRIDVGGKTWKALTAAGVIDDKIDLRKQDEGKYDYSQIALKLFSKGGVDSNDIDANDVQQGQIGDCYFMSAIASVARANPEAIRKLIVDHGDGSFDVTLYSKAGKLHLEPTIVNVKPQFPTDANGKPIYADSGDGELWVMILEKAYAKMHGGYDDAGEGGMIEDGLEALTGVEASYYMCADYEAAQLKQMITDALKAKKPITAASEGSGEKEFKTKSGKTIYQGHAYSVKSISGDVVQLQNPWGHSHADLTTAELKQYFNHIAY